MSRTDRSSLLKNAPAAGLAVVLLAGGVIIATGSDDEGYVVKAVMKDAAGLRKNSDVKIGGVAAGTVSKIELGEGDRAIVTMKIDDGGYPIGAGASTVVRPVNLLGEKFVELTPGDLDRPEKSGSTIAMAKNTSSVELDDVLNTLDPGTRGRLRVLINETGLAIGGKGTDLNATIERLPRSLAETTTLVRSFASENERMKHAILEGDRVLGSLNGGRDDLAALVDSAQRTLRETTQNRASLGATIGDAPATLAQLRATLEKLQTTAVRLKPAAAQIRRAAPPLTNALAELPDFVHSAKPTLAKAEDVAPTLGRLGSRGTPIIKRITPVAADLDMFAKTLEPLSRTLDYETNSGLRLLEGWARTIQSRDNAGHLFRTEIQVNKELIEQLLTQGTAKKPGSDSKGLTDPLAPAPAPQSLPFPFSSRESEKATPPAAAPTAPATPATPPTPKPKPAPKADDPRQLLDYLLGG